MGKYIQSIGGGGSFHQECYAWQDRPSEMEGWMHSHTKSKGVYHWRVHHLTRNAKGISPTWNEQTPKHKNMQKHKLTGRDKYRSQSQRNLIP